MSDTTTTDAATELVDTYFDMWRATDDGRRRELVAEVFAPDGRHVDPLADARGHDELAAMIANVHTHYPGFALERTSGIDQHGDQLRFAWRLDAADGTPVVTGLDVAELSPDGRLARIAGFWGELPAR
ncbi:MAG TPA: nuclear transport factor 2 family protein [Acidimicrobiales bacterium]